MNPPFAGVCFALALAVVPAVAAEYDSKGGALYDTILAQDTAFFDAFNTCDLEKLGALTADDLQFFHDKGGLSVGKAAFLDSVQKNVCGKFTRELVPGTFEVWPIPDYGALAIGTHKFIHPNRNAEPDGIGKFMMLWKNIGGHWVVTQTFSYAHAEAPH